MDDKTTYKTMTVTNDPEFKHGVFQVIGDDLGTTQCIAKFVTPDDAKLFADVMTECEEMRT